MKTSLTKLIEWMDSRAITHESVRQKATELLEEEKQMVIDSWIDGEGRFFDAGTEIIEAEKYFNETFEQ